MCSIRCPRVKAGIVGTIDVWVQRKRKNRMRCEQTRFFLFFEEDHLLLVDVAGAERYHDVAGLPVFE